MAGLFLILVGFVMTAAAVAWMFTPWVLVAAGVVLMLVGAFVDFDRLKEPPRAKRHSAAP